MIKRITYTQVRFAVPGGTVEIKSSNDGYAVLFEPSKDPRVSYGKTIEEAGTMLVMEMKRIAFAVEEDLKAFVARNINDVHVPNTDRPQVK